MFSNFDSDVIGFDSSLETATAMNDKSSQTAELKTENQTTQTRISSSVGTETNSEDSSNLSAVESYDVERLSKFLKRILPHLEEELKSVEKSNEFELKERNIEAGNVIEKGNESELKERNIEAGSVIEKDQKSSESQVEMIFRPKFCEDKIISCLSWNSTGTLFALGFSEKSHQLFCPETSIGVFHVGKDQFEKSNPIQVTKVPGCCTCIKFHNHRPHILAAGLHNGKMLIWDLKQDEPVSVDKTLPLHQPIHKGGVSVLYWRENECGLQLISGGKEGTIILWAIDPAKLTYEVVDKYVLPMQHFMFKAKRDEYIGVDCLDVVPNSLKLVAGSRAGIFFCDLDKAVPFISDFKDPVVRQYKLQLHWVISVSCNPDFFASSGTDSEIQVFRYNQVSPIVRIHTSYKSLFGVEWISPDILLSWGDSKVLMHKLQERNFEYLVCKVEEPISSLALKTSSHKSKNAEVNNKKLAIGNQRGTVAIISDQTTP